MPSEADLIAAWHGTQTVAQIASGLGVRAYTIERAWALLKHAGKLPNVSRRAHHLGPTPEQVRARERQRHAAAEKRRRERGPGHPSDAPDWNSVNDLERRSAALRAKLEEVHGEPRYDIAPQLLRRTA